MNKKQRKFLYFLASLFVKRSRLVPSSHPLDVIIPVIEKDLKILPLCLEGIKQCVSHPISAIYLVAPENRLIRSFCAERNLVFIDENSVLGYSPRSIRYLVNGHTDRSGWIFQQLLKLSGTLGEAEEFLVVDADHILLRPHTFVDANGKYVFYQSKEFHSPYYVNAFKLLGRKNISWLSYVAHKMIFSKKELSALKKEIESQTGQRWDRAIIQSLDANELSSFSEYEMYGNYIPACRKITLPWRNKNLCYSSLASYEELQKKYGNRYRAVTFPDYKNG